MARTSSPVATTFDQILPLRAAMRLAGRALQQEFAGSDDRHTRTELADVIDDVSGEDHCAVTA